MRSCAVRVSSAMQAAMAIEDLLHPYLGRYLGAPRWLKASAGRAYSLIPPRVRLGGTYKHFRGEIAAGETARAHELLSLAELEATPRWAGDTAPADPPVRRP